MARDPRIDAYIAAAQPFAQPILRAVRERLHAALPKLDETIKWGMPFFTLEGRPFANMAAFKQHASFGFWRRDAAPTGREGEAMGQFGRLTSVADLPAPAAFAALVARQLAVGERPRQRAAPRPEAAVPPELAAALAAEPVARAAFEGFSPSHRREYCEWIAEAKRAETRTRRVAETITALREGKPRHWRHGAR